MKKSFGILALGGLFLSAPAHAVILFGAGNETNLTDPGMGLPFDSVARVHSAPGLQNGGSAVHLGGGFMLTAAHIANNELDSVTFDGSSFLPRDLSYLPTRIGDTDLKLFKLASVPSVGSANLYTGSAELVNGATLVGWGRQRAEPVNVGPSIVPIAGGNTPLVKRWGTNQPLGIIDDFVYTSGTTYTFDAIQTVMGTNQGDFEAAGVSRDSGSGLFQQIGGEWFLTGITSLFLAQSGGNVTFGNDLPWVFTPNPGNDHIISFTPGSGDANVFVQVSSYADAINQIIPEPSATLLGLLGIPFLLRRRR